MRKSLSHFNGMAALDFFALAFFRDSQTISRFHEAPAHEEFTEKWCHILRRYEGHIFEFFGIPPEYLCRSSDAHK